MKRLALSGLLALASACDLPLVMVEIEAPEVCVTQIVDIDPTNMLAGASGTNELPSQMGANIGAQLGTTINIDDTLVDLPAEAKDLLDLDVQIKRIRITALAPHEAALDQVNALSFTVVPPDGSGLAPKTILAMTSDPAAPSGAPIEASGQEINLAQYLYAGQLRFTYALDATIVVAEPWQVEVLSCVSTRGYVEASYDDFMAL
jgi:hypothetical protein